MWLRCGMDTPWVRDTSLFPKIKILTPSTDTWPCWHGFLNLKVHLFTLAVNSVWFKWFMRTTFPLWDPLPKGEAFQDMDSELRFSQSACSVLLHDWGKMFEKHAALCLFHTWKPCTVLASSYQCAQGHNPYRKPHGPPQHLCCLCHFSSLALTFSCRAWWHWKSHENYGFCVVFESRPLRIVKASGFIPKTPEKKLTVILTISPFYGIKSKHFTNHLLPTLSMSSYVSLPLSSQVPGFVVFKYL